MSHPGHPIYNFSNEDEFNAMIGDMAQSLHSDVWERPRALKYTTGVTIEDREHSFEYYDISKHIYLLHNTLWSGVEERVMRREKYRLAYEFLNKQAKPERGPYVITSQPIVIKTVECFLVFLPDEAKALRLSNELILDGCEDVWVLRFEDLSIVDPKLDTFTPPQNALVIQLNLPPRQTLCENPKVQSYALDLWPALEMIGIAHIRGLDCSKFMQLASKCGPSPGCLCMMERGMLSEAAEPIEMDYKSMTEADACTLVQLPTLIEGIRATIPYSAFRVAFIRPKSASERAEVVPCIPTPTVASIIAEKVLNSRPFFGYDIEYFFGIVGSCRLPQVVDAASWIFVAGYSRRVHTPTSWHYWIPSPLNDDDAVSLGILHDGSKAFNIVWPVISSSLPSILSHLTLIQERVKQLQNIVHVYGHHELGRTRTQTRETRFRLQLVIAAPGKDMCKESVDKSNR